jgi:hypothetical protein
MPRWTAAQQLSRIALKKPLQLTEWRDDMNGQILPAQRKLREAIVQRRITDIQGRLGPPGSKERMPDDLFSDSEFTLLVEPHGALTVHPPHKRHKFEEKYKINLDNWWREIDFDQDEGEQAFSASLAPCQEQQPGRSYLRLVSGARSGETEAPAARAEESRPESEPELESKPEPESKPESESEPELAKAEHAALQPIEPATTEPAPTEPQPNERTVAEPLADSANPAATPHPGGRPPVANWSMVGEEVFRLMNDNGEFTVDDPEWNAQARLEEAIADFCESKFKTRPSETTIKDNIHEPLKQWRQSRSET